MPLAVLYYSVHPTQWFGCPYSGSQAFPKPSDHEYYIPRSGWAWFWGFHFDAYLFVERIWIALHLRKDWRARGIIKFHRINATVFVKDDAALVCRAEPKTGMKNGAGGIDKSDPGIRDILSQGTIRQFYRVCLWQIITTLIEA